MARPKKQGMDYFPHDTDALTDEKIDALRSLYGNDGYAFYFILLERIYRSNDFEIDVSDPEMVQILSKKIGISVDVFHAILKTALKRECFDIEEYENRQVLTSDGIKKRANVVLTKRVNAKVRGFSGVIRAETPQETQQETPQITTTESTQRKEKKRKEKKSKEYIKTIVDESTPLGATIKKFIDFRDDIKSSMTDNAVELLIAKLNTIAADDQTRIEILNRSIMNGWKGIFPIIEAKQGVASQKPPNRFHNFKGDMSSMTEAEIDEALRRKEERRNLLKVVQDG